MKKAIAKVSENLDSALKRSALLTRSHASNGIWLAFLLPSVIVVAAYREENISDSFRFSAVISSGLFGATTIFIAYLATTTKNVRRFSPLFYVPAVVTSTLLFIFLKEGIFVSLVCGLGASFSYFVGLPMLLGRFPHSFTFGEGSIVAQAVVIFLITSLMNIFRVNNPQELSDLDKSTLILQVGLLGCGVIILSVSHFNFLKHAPWFYFAILSVTFGFIVPVLHYLLEESPVLWIIGRTFSKPKTVILVLYWSCCLAIAAFAVKYQLSRKVTASTAARKNFHYLMLAVYIPGIIVDGTFLYLASGVILAVFLLLDTMRILKVAPLGNLLQKSFKILADEKDQGVLAVTPIYLLAGCSLPLWVHPTSCSGKPESFLLAMAGIMSVGIGDTAASVGGFCFGKHKWPGSMKSFEGTAISIVCQSLALVIFFYLGFTESSPSLLLQPFVAMIITSILEAKTDQVDNLVLPFVQLLLML